MMIARFFYSFALLAVLGLSVAPVAVYAAEDAHHGAEAASDEEAMHSENAHHEAGNAAHAEPDGLPQLDPSSWPSQIFWLLVTFLVLYVILAKRVLPDISTTVENRKNHLDADLKSAEQLHAEGEAALAAYESSLVQAREAASGKIVEVEQDMKAKADTEMAAFQARSESALHGAEARIEDAKAKAMGQMNDIVAEVAAHAVQKIIGIDMDSQQAKAAVETLNAKKKAA